MRWLTRVPLLRQDTEKGINSAAPPSTMHVYYSTLGPLRHDTKNDKESKKITSTQLDLGILVLLAK